MSNSSEEFASHAKAEWLLCDDVGPALAAVIRDIELHLGLCIDEIRVTVDWTNGANGSMGPTCTIVRAHVNPASDGDDRRRTGHSTETPGGGLSSSQGRSLE